MSFVPEPIPCVLCDTLTRGRAFLVPTPQEWGDLVALGLARGDAVAVPLCIGHDMTNGLPDRVAAALLRRIRALARSDWRNPDTTGGDA